MNSRPFHLKQGAFFHNGKNYAGVVTTVDLPDLESKREEQEVISMMGAWKLNKGITIGEVSIKGVDYMPDIAKVALAIDGGQQLFQVYGYFSQDTGPTGGKALEILIKGSVTKRAGFTTGGGENTEFEFTVDDIEEYQEKYDGTEIYYYNRSLNIFNVNGINQFAEMNAALGQ